MWSRFLNVSEGSVRGSHVDVDVCLQVLKWNFLTPREEYVDQLKNQMATCVAKWQMEDLFHTDFQKHIKAISTMMEVSPRYTVISKP